MDVFEALGAVVDEIEWPLCGAEIVGLLRLRDRLDAKLTAALAEFDSECRWELDGATSLAAWLRGVGGRGRRDASRLRATAERLDAMPDVAAAWQTGTLLSGHVDAIVANVDRRAVRLFAEHQAELVPEPARTPAERRADALADVAKFFLDHHTHNPKRRHRPHVSVIIELDDDQHSRYESGTPMSTVAASMALCDCELHRLVMGAHSEVLDYGRATRVVSVGMWSSLAARLLARGRALPARPPCPRTCGAGGSTRGGRPPSRRMASQAQ